MLLTQENFLSFVVWFFNRILEPAPGGDALSQSATRSLTVNVAGQPRVNPVPVPTYLHAARRPGATVNAKVTVVCCFLNGSQRLTRKSSINLLRLRALAYTRILFCCTTSLLMMNTIKQLYADVTIPNITNEIRLLTSTVVITILLLAMLNMAMRSYSIHKCVIWCIVSS